MPHFERCYARYSSTYTCVGDVLRRARQEDAAVDDFISGAERASGCALGALLFRPVQRMCVYPLLFKELLKKEGKAGCEESAIVDVHRASLHRAMSAMHAVVMQVNEEVRKLETQLQLLQLLAR